MRTRLMLGAVVAPLALLLASAGQLRSADSSFRVSPLLATHTAAPGETVKGRLLVVNPGQSPVSLSVTPGDFVSDAEGADTWSPLGSHASSLGDWITFTPSFLTVMAGGEAWIDYQIEVPSSGAGGAPLEGSRWAALSVKAESDRRPLHEPVQGVGPTVGMKVTLVYAVKIYLDLAGSEQRRLAPVSLLGGDRPGSLVATFANQGNVMLRPRVWMEVRSLEGAVVGRLESLKWTLQPRTEHHYRFALQELPAPLPDGRYQVVVVADYGGDRMEGLSAPLVLASNGSGP